MPHQLHHFHGTDEEVTTIRVIHQARGKGLVLPNAPLRQGELPSCPLCGLLHGKGDFQQGIVQQNFSVRDNEY